MAQDYVHCERITRRTNVCGWEKMRQPLAAKAGTYGHLTLLDLLPRHRRLIALAQQCVCSMWDFNNPLLAWPQTSFLEITFMIFNCLCILFPHSAFMTSVLGFWICFFTLVFLFFYFFPGPFKDFQWATKSPDRYITVSLGGWYWGAVGRKERWRREEGEIRGKEREKNDVWKGSG